MNFCYLAGPHIAFRHAARGNTKALIAAGVNMVPEPRHARVVTLHDDPLNFPAYFERYPDLRKCYVVGCCVSELDQLAEDRQRAIALVNEIWTPSQFCEQVFAAHHDNVKRVPHLVERPELNTAVTHHLRRGISYDPAKFYFYAIAACDDPRKNLAAAITAFRQLSEEYPNQIAMIIKHVGTSEPSPMPDENVTVLRGHLSTQEMSALHGLCNVYVSPHRAEGWGRCLAQAMAYGNPVVATAYSGNLDFMCEYDSYLVDHQLRELSREEAAGFNGDTSPSSRWADVDTAGLLAAMRTAFDARSKDDRGWRASGISMRYGIESLTRCMIKRLAPFDQLSGDSRTSARAVTGAMLPRVGLFHNPAPKSDLVLGRERAADAMVQAYLRFGRDYHYSLISRRQHVAELSGKLWLPGHRAEVHSREALESLIEDGSISVWHDIQLNTFAPFVLRSRAITPFPITLLHHTISYKTLLQGPWLSLLLARPHRYDAMICSSFAARDALRNILDNLARKLNAAHGCQLAFNAHYEVIPLGVDLDRFKPRDGAAARAELGIANDAFVILWVGRLSPVDKADLMPLLRIFGELRKQHAWRQLTLVCCGTERKHHGAADALRDYAKHLELGDDFKLITDHPAKAEQLYATADVFVSPSDNLQESFGLAVLEAMASGVPQVVSDWDGYRDTVVDGETGFTIPTYWAKVDDDLQDVSSLTDWQDDHLALSQSVAVDVSAMFDALNRLIEDDELRARMAAQSRRRAEEHYGWATIVAAHERLWRELRREAQRSPERHVNTLDHAIPNHCTSFAGYPTRMLADDAAFSLTDWGLRVAHDDDMLPLHYLRRWQYLDTALASALIRQLHVSHRDGSQLSFSEAIESMRQQGRRRYHPAAVRRHMMWLFKHGVVELCAAR